MARHRQSQSLSCFGSSLRSHTRSLVANLQAKALSVQRACSGDGENHQAESSQKYSTEGGSRNWRGRLQSHNIHSQQLQDEKQRQVHREKNQQNSSAMQHKNPKNENKKSDQPQRHRQQETRELAASSKRSEQDFFTKKIRKRSHTQHRNA